MQFSSLYKHVHSVTLVNSASCLYCIVRPMVISKVILGRFSSGKEIDKGRKILI